jgi:hypothetical protein
MATLALPDSGLRAALPRRQQLALVQPHNGAHRVALRAGLSFTIPLLVLWLTGHLALSPYAAFGSFTSLYGRLEPYARRLRMQLQAGTGFVIAVTVGTSVACSADRRWLAVLGVTCCAVTGSLAADRLRWHPFGPIFLVFGAAALASMPATPARIPAAAALAAAAALLATAIAAAGRPLRCTGRAIARAVSLGAGLARAATGSVAGTTSVPPGASVAPGVPVPSDVVVPPGAALAAQTSGSPAATAGPADQSPWQWAQAARNGVAVLLSGTAAAAIGVGHPSWCMVAAVAAVTGPDTTARLTRAVHRALGTQAGVLVAAALLAPHPPAVTLIAAIFVLQAGAELLVGRNYGLAMLCVTPLALLMGSLAQPAAAGVLLRDRAIETLLGAAIGIAVDLAVYGAPRVRHSPA